MKKQYPRRELEQTIGEVRSVCALVRSIAHLTRDRRPIMTIKAAEAWCNNPSLHLAAEASEASWGAQHAAQAARTWQARAVAMAAAFVGQAIRMEDCDRGFESLNPLESAIGYIRQVLPEVKSKKV